MKKSYIVSLVLGLIILNACGKAASPVTVEPLSSNAAELNVRGYPSKIIGTSELIKVKADGSNIEAKLRSKLDAFGVLKIEQTATNGGGGLCSATHLGNGYVLTAGHCFFNESTPGDQKEMNKPCPEMKVFWGYRGSKDTGDAKSVFTGQSQCLQVVYAELSSVRDFGIFKVDQAPKVSIAMASDTKRPAANTKLTIFGYPQGRPLEWSQYCALKKTLGKADGMPKALPDSMFAYSCDTEPGNSGSSILAVSASGEVKVVGIHDAATPDGVQYNMGTYLFDARKVMQENGINFSALVGSN